MRERIKNSIYVEVEGVDLTTISNVEFYVRQKPEFYEKYPVNIASASEMVVTIPFEDAMRLTTGPAQLQFAFVDERGTPRASDIVVEDVGRLLAKEGYNP